MKIHFVYRPGSRAHCRVLRYRPGEGAVYEKRGDKLHTDREQWKRAILCLTPKERADLLRELIAEGYPLDPEALR